MNLAVGKVLWWINDYHTFPSVWFIYFGFTEFKQTTIQISLWNGLNCGFFAVGVKLNWLI